MVKEIETKEINGITFYKDEKHDLWYEKNKDGAIRYEQDTLWQKHEDNAQSLGEEPEETFLTEEEKNE